MRIKRLYIYIIKEFIPNYFLGFTFFSIFLLIQLLFQIVSLYVEKNVPLTDVLELLIYGIAWVVSFSIPIAVLLGTVLSLGRVSGDAEIIAMRANGIGLVTVFKPIIFMGIIIMAFNIYYYETIYPWGMFKYYSKYTNLGVQDPTTQLSENFIYDDRSQSPYVIQVDKVERKTRDLIKVRITSVSENKLIIAERGRFLEFDSRREIFPLELINTITQPLNPEKEKDMGDAKFYEMRSDRMILNIPFKLPDNNFSGNYSGNMSISQLWINMRKRELKYALKMIENVNSQAEIVNTIINRGAEVEYVQTKQLKDSNYVLKMDDIIKENMKKAINSDFSRLKNDHNELVKSSKSASEHVPEKYIRVINKKFSYSVSCLVFALLGAPLAVFSARSGKGFGLGISLLFIAVWYVAYFISERIFGSLGEIDIMGMGIFVLDLTNPLLRAWTPPVILLPVVFLFWYNKLKT